MLDDRLEQGTHVRAGLLGVEHRIAIERRGIDHREIELLLGCAQLVEQIEGGIDHVVEAGAGTVDLVDDHDRLEPLRERLARHEARLRHRPLDGIDEQQHTVDHGEDPLDLSAKVGMPGGVDDIDVRALVLDGTVLCQDRDAALLFQVVAVHDAFGDVLILPERAGLAQQLVNQRGLAVIDVGDDGDVTKGAAHAWLALE